jgi:3-oxoacyl-[acyl-carrier protein] reductase
VKLDGRVAIVTGAGRGIGRATALELARAGAALVVNDVEGALATEVAAEIERDGGRARACPGSVTARADVARLAESAFALGGCHILVNNAGLSESKPLTELAADDFERVVDSHLLGTFLCMRALLPRMLAQRQGRIVNLVSRAGLVGSPGMAAYGAGKGGIFALTNVAARELAGSGVTVNAVNPAATDTRMVTGALAALAPSGEAGAARVRALRAALQPAADVAVAIAVLCADEAAHVNGQIFYVARDQLGLFAPLAVTQSVPRAAAWTASDALGALGRLRLHPLEEPYR